MAKRRHAGRRGASAKFNRAICRLRRMTPSQQIKALSSSNAPFLRSLCANVKKLKHAKLPSGISQRLRRNAKTIRKLIHRKTTMGSKRKILSQRGGIAPLLLAALPALGSILGGVISRV